LVTAASAAIQDQVLTNFWFSDGPVHAIAEANGTVYIGGQFNYVGPYTGSSAFLDSASGARDDTFPQFDGPIRAAIPDGAGGWFVGGEFFMIGEEVRPGVAHILPDKTVDPAWDAMLLGSVSAMALSGNTLYLAGSIVLIGGEQRYQLAAVNAATGALLAWDGNPVGFFNRMTISAMAASGGNVFIGGTFTNAGGLNRTNLALLNGTTGAALPWTPNPELRRVGAAGFRQHALRGRRVPPNCGTKSNKPRRDRHYFRQCAGVAQRLAKRHRDLDGALRKFFVHRRFFQSDRQREQRRPRRH
jgi:hypothetical protein